MPSQTSICTCKVPNISKYWVEVSVHSNVDFIIEVRLNRIIQFLAINTCT